MFSRNVDHVDGPSKGADVNKTCRLAMPNIVLLPCRTLTIEPKNWITVPQTETAKSFPTESVDNCVGNPRIAGVNGATTRPGDERR